MTENLADAFSKPGANNSLDIFLDTGVLSQSLLLWIIKDELGMEKKATDETSAIDED